MLVVATRSSLFWQFIHTSKQLVNTIHEVIYSILTGFDTLDVVGKSNNDKGGCDWMPVAL